MANMELVLQQMTELTNAVKAAKAPKQDLQWDDVEKAFGAQIEALVAAQVDAKLKAAPTRIPGEVVGANRQIGSNNRYAKMLKSFENHGIHTADGLTYKPVDLAIAAIVMEAQQKHYSPQIDRNKPVPMSQDLQAVLKAMTSTGSGTGDELVPTGMAAQLWEDFFLASRVAGTMTRIPMPTNPFDVPLGLGALTWRKGTENTATTASDPATAKSTLTATELITEQNWSYTLDEDAIIAMAPAIRGEIARSGAEIIDDFALNADSTNASTGNINLDDADPDDASYYISDGQDGIRHQWLVDNTGQTINAGGDALTDADILAMQVKLGKYAVDPMSTVMVCGPSTYLNGLLALTNVITVDKFGPSAVVLTGQLAAYRGIPIVVSPVHRLAKADGKLSTTAGNNTLGSISMYNRNMWYAGFRRDLVIETDRNIQTRKYIMVTSLRQAVASRGTRSSNTHTAGIRNILV